MNALTWCICVLDFVGSVVILALMLETTPHASVRGFIRGEAEGRWAMIRRIVYGLVAIALFGKAVFVLDGRITVQPLDAALWMILVGAILIYPALRAFKVVDQDKWMGIHKNGNAH